MKTTPPPNTVEGTLPSLMTWLDHWRSPVWTSKPQWEMRDNPAWHLRSLNCYNASFSVAGLREITFGKHTFTTKVHERHGQDIRVLNKKNEGGWIGCPLFRGGK